MITGNVLESKQDNRYDKYKYLHQIFKYLPDKNTAWLCIYCQCKTVIIIMVVFWRL